MSALQFTGERRPGGRMAQAGQWLGVPPGAALAASGLVALFVLWAAHDGGYDADTWYWGALLVLAGDVVVLLSGGARRLWDAPFLRRSVLGLAGYVAFSYLSILWASSPGDALTGSDRALLYLELFVLLGALPWSARAARCVLVSYAVAIGVLAVITLIRLAAADHLSTVLLDGRLASPTGYYNSSAALFFGSALVSVALAAGRRLPGLLRGLLIAMACAELQLTLVAQSRGWLFTLPLVLALSIVLVRGRLRTLAVAVLPALATVGPAHRLLAVYDSSGPAQLTHAAEQAGRTGLVICFAAFVLATILCWGDQLLRATPSRRTVRLTGTVVAAVIAVAAVAGAFAATHGDPGGFISRQWRGFSHPSATEGTGSHFATVGSARYDVWRVSLDAFAAHPFGGLGQDNFADYYLPRRHSDEEPSWTHSLEMRLLAHTGLVGTALFLSWLGFALARVLRVRRRGEPPRSEIAAIALLPLVVWVLHGSVDWFWEVPALSGPAIAFLAMGAALLPRDRGSGPAQPGPRRASRVTLRLPAVPGPVLGGLGLLGLLAATVALAFPYLAVREQSRASNEAAHDPGAALAALRTAAQLDPLDATAPRLAGAIALRNDLPNVAEARFQTAIAREPGGWFGWFGAGLSASTLGDSATAARDLRRAAAINSHQVAVREALRRVTSAHPLTPAQAFRLLVVVD